MSGILCSARSFLQRLEATLSVEHRAVGVAIVRILLGANVFFLYITHFRQWSFIWGDDGVFPYPAFFLAMHFQHNLSLYEIGTSPQLHFAIFVTGIIVTTLFTLGYCTRISAVLFYIFTWSLYSRNPIVLDGGDNLLYLLAIYLIFCDSGRYFSLDSFRRNLSQPNRFVALLHNFGVLAILLQLSILYFTSGWAKLRGGEWIDGTAIYYVLRTAEFNLVPWAQSIYTNAWLVATLCYTTMFFQISFPFLIWNRRIKPFVFCAAVGFHLGIAWFMGLAWFSWTMIAAEFVVLSDSQYFAFGAFVRRVSSSLITNVKRLFPPRGEEEVGSVSVT